MGLLIIHIWYVYVYIYILFIYIYKLVYGKSITYRVLKKQSSSVSAQWFQLLPCTPNFKLAIQTCCRRPSKKRVIFVGSSNSHSSTLMPGGWGTLSITCDTVSDGCFFILRTRYETISETGTLRRSRGVGTIHDRWYYPIFDGLSPRLSDRPFWKACGDTTRWPVPC